MSMLPKISKLTLFLWWCSGADTEILKKLPFEKNKYAAIGASIISATVLAILSGTYIFSIVFYSTFLGILFGLMLGALVFILDRYTTSLLQDSSAGALKFRQSIPALVISLFISILIAVPILFKLFEKEILNEYIHQRALQLDKSDMMLDSLQTKVREEIQAINRTKSEKMESVNKKYEEYMAEVKGASGPNISGEGPIAQIRKNEYYRERMEYREMSARNDSLIFLLSKRISDLETEKLKSRKMENAITFVDMLQSLNKLRQGNPSIQWPIILITLLFSLLNSAPIILRLFFRKGFYETLVSLRDEVIIANLENKERSLADNQSSKKAAEALRKKYKNIDPEIVEDELKELTNDSGSPALGKFEAYLTKVLESFSTEINRIEKRAKTLYWQGITFSVIGIMIAFGFLAFWLNYFSIKRFETYHLFVLGSGTLIIIIVEFLGAWFLKQHRLTAEKSSQMLANKAVLDRFMLIHFAIHDFADKDQKGNYLSELLHTLGKDLKFPHASSINFDNSDFASDTYASLMNVTKNVKG